MGTGQQRENRLLRHGKAGRCTPDCPDRHPACSDRCEKYRAWKAEVQKEKTYTKSQNDAGKINRNDFDAEFWMGGKHK